MGKLFLLVISACLASSVCLAGQSNHIALNQVSKPGFIGPDTSEEISVKYILDNGHDDMQVIIGFGA